MWIAPVPSHNRRVEKLSGRAGHICESILSMLAMYPLTSTTLDIQYIFISASKFSWSFGIIYLEICYNVWFKACLLCTVMGAFPVTVCPSILRRLAKECHSKQCFIHHLDDERNKSSHFYSSNRSNLKHSELGLEFWSETLQFTEW